MIDAGRVTVNGEIAERGRRAGKDDRLCIDDKPVDRAPIPAQWLMYHKSPGKIVACDVEDSVFDDLPPLDRGRWMSVGRLDVGTEGLLLFSTDGEWVHRMAHPRHGIEREYYVRASGEIAEETMADIIRHGTLLDKGELVQPLVFRLERRGEGSNHWYRIVLSEGRNRVVRRLFEKCHLTISRLLRTRFGVYRLPDDLPAGICRSFVPDDSNSERDGRNQ
jgi:23S rRNA pseudouridine2605 synthase